MTLLNYARVEFLSGKQYMGPLVQNSEKSVRYSENPYYCILLCLPNHRINLMIC